MNPKRSIKKMIMKEKSSPFTTIALIMAAGRGQRMGSILPKQYLPLTGQQSILEKSIKAFLENSHIDAVRVVIGKEDHTHYDHAIRTISSDKLLPPIIGGEERCTSVRLGLRSLADFSPQFVLVHDGARPFVSQDLIDRVQASLQKHQGVIPGIPVVDTLKRGDAHQNIAETVERQNLYQAQTPQGFHYKTILEAHQTLQNTSNLTDDARLLEHLNIPVHLIPGDPQNKKITTPEDFKGESMPLPDIRVGHGIDVHALGPGNGLTILGIFIPTNFSLIGHSDADVGLHSLTDALLGTIGDGDIGQHFNPQEERWKGADSTLFLIDAARRVQEKGGQISHVDITLLGERPKFSPYRSQMIEKVSEILKIDTSRVSVKATTTEKLGFLGRKEGLAAFATATVILS